MGVRYGEPLDWEELERARSCVIKKDYEVGGWQTIYETVVDAMVRLEKATKPEIEKIKV